MRCRYDVEEPLVTGVVAVGDAWAYTVPTVGRGLAKSLQHSLVLRDTLRQAGLSDPVGLVARFAAATNDGLDRIYRTGSSLSSRSGCRPVLHRWMSSRPIAE
ncbi:hypothetical protein ABZ848_46930 [Streptomyces sp. NPDC047081]|uniref:hypothetical protein n=1 Tax=Streptomyces sp. NPDC047081 TaxID=3154706 RepID=UPI0033C7965E